MGKGALACPRCKTPYPLTGDRCAVCEPEDLVEIKKEFDLPLSYNPDVLNAMRDIHEGSRAFIIGNGPSLRWVDTDNLWEEITFGCNDIRLIFPHFVPSYWVIEDFRYFNAYYREIHGNDITTKLVNACIEAHTPNEIQDENTITWVSVNVFKPLFSPDIIKYGVYAGKTVVFAMLQLAWFMGIRDFVLIGVDHSLSGDLDHKKHFHPEYNSAISYQDNERRDLVAMEKAFIAAKLFIEANGGRIVNATPGSRLRMFQEVEFDKLF